MASDDVSGEHNLLRTRRAFWAQSSALLAAGALSRIPAAHAGESELIPDSMRTQGRPLTTPPYGQPAPYEVSVVRTVLSGAPTATAGSSLTPLQRLHGIVTPNGLVFERHHAGAPDINPERHRLLVHGLVERRSCSAWTISCACLQSHASIFWSARATRRSSGKQPRTPCSAATVCCPVASGPAFRCLGRAARVECASYV